MRITERNANTASTLKAGRFVTLCGLFCASGAGASKGSRLILSVLATALGVLALSVAPALAAPETPLTEKATAVTGTTAELHGEPNPNTKATVGYEFHFNSNGSCEGNTVGGVPPAELLAGTKVSTPVVGLEGSTQYLYCIVANNEAGESTPGNLETFKTLASKPVVGTESVSGLTPFAVSLSAEVNPENQQSTTCVFEYGEVVTEHSTPCEQGVVEGSSPVTVTLNVAGLNAATKYHYRVAVTNGTGEQKGTEEAFTTLTAEKPAIDGEGSTAVTPTGALLSAQINPNYQITSWQFKLGTNTSYTLGVVPATAGSLSAGFGDQEVRAGTAGLVLAPNTVYHYEVTATNGAGTSEGLTAQGDKTFLTLPAPPTVSTEAVSAVTGSTASVAGSVDPGSTGVNSATTYYFQYGTSTGYGSQSPVVPQSAGEGTSPVVERAQLSGLEPGRTYHYRIVASNDNENKAGGLPQTVYGEDATFSTTAIPIPTVETGGAGGVTQTTASVSAVIDDRGSQTSYELDIGTDTSYGAKIFGNAGAGSGPEPVTVALVELTPGTTYHYRFIATSSFGVAYGADRTFTTPGFPVGLPAAPVTAALVPVSATVFPGEAADTDTSGVKPKPTKCRRGLVRKHGRCVRKPRGKRASIHAGIRGGK